MPALRVSPIATLLFLLFASSGLAQDESGDKKKQSDGLTVKGRIMQHEKEEFKIDLNSLNCMLNQQVKLPEPPVPEEEWPKMTPRQREQWVKDFEASDRGKAFIADRKQRIEAAQRFEIQVEEDGNFVLYDVPHGIYGIRGRTEKQIDDKSYVFEIFGQIEFKDVEETLLDPMTVMVTRQVKPNEDIPTINIKTFDDKATIDNRLLADRNVLVSFWSLKSPPSVQFAKTVHETFDAVKKQKQLQLLSICIDSDRQQALKHVIDNDLGGWHGFASSWDHATVSEFGVRSIPSLFLLGSDGKVKMTPLDFRYAINAADTDLTQVILDVLAGKTVPTPARTKPPAEKKIKAGTTSR